MDSLRPEARAVPHDRVKMFTPPDNFSPELCDELVAMYEQSAARLKKIIIAPPGGTDNARAFNQARAGSLMAQVDSEITSLKHRAATWTGKEISASVAKGAAVADRQLKSIEFPIQPSADSFSLIQHDAIRVLAQDTASDLVKAADSMKANAFTTLRRMAAAGVTNQQVNLILSGAIIEGKPREATLQLQAALEKVHGKKVEIPTRDGGVRTYDVDFYARMVAQTKMREATVTAKHERFVQQGVELCIIIGNVTVHFCTNFLGHVYSLTGRAVDGHPPLDSIPSGGPPFHPFCSKSTAPFIRGLSKETAMRKALAA